ncbi:hypothetical protein [Rhodovulum sulfidophilum]|uniref:Uncharacterized protein n=1 Tax=Rhodovulum sulfidophilum TaxID=35806 RepID=A0ABS1RYK7_RHOSU|nr:hypothetical protein [Rhodovulum sulfidophilum]MBL3610044.1 hypothetical protein [Rhodovulum sulfidophilum]MCE8455810.1 hypothetical protein [Rhodovulum sulfidophilum]
MIGQGIRGVQLLRALQFLDRFDDGLAERYPETRRREGFIRRALDEFATEAAQ